MKLGFYALLGNCVVGFLKVGSSLEVSVTVKNYNRVLLCSEQTVVREEAGFSIFRTEKGSWETKYLQ